MRSEALFTNEPPEEFSDHSKLKDLENDLLACGKVMEFEADTTLAGSSSACKKFMWILEGCVRVYRNSKEGREITLYRVMPGELCLMTLDSLLHGRHLPANAITETKTKSIVLTAEQFPILMDQLPQFRNYVVSTLAARAECMMRMVADITFQRLDLRLACLLGGLFQQSGGSPLKITHDELAKEVGSSREVISRILKELEHQDCLRLSRGSIHMKSTLGQKWFQK